MFTVFCLVYGEEGHKDKQEEKKQYIKKNKKKRKKDKEGEAEEGSKKEKGKKESDELRTILFLKTQLASVQYVRQYRLT